jgi:hypothetical protein
MEELLADHVTSLNAIHLGAAATRVSQLFIKQQQQQGGTKRSLSQGLPENSVNGDGSSTEAKLLSVSKAPEHLLSFVGDGRQLQHLLHQLERLYQHALSQLEARYDVCTLVKRQGMYLENAGLGTA